MATQRLSLRGHVLPCPRIWHRGWYALAHRRLNEAHHSARVVPFDDETRLVFFSDLHRGDRSRADGFARNEALFNTVLERYHQEGFTYVEVGDGDELWKNRRFSDILRAHPRTFELLHRFAEGSRLHILFGNHDIQGGRCQPMDKDGIPAREALILEHAVTGQRIFVTHGHQADFTSNELYVVARFALRHVWRKLQLAGLASTTGRPPLCPDDVESPASFRTWLEEQRAKIEMCITEWVQGHRQITICGHTHRPMSSPYGAPPYFNTGSGVYPGFLTGLELRNGELSLVRWAGPGGDAIRRDVMAAPKGLGRLLVAAPGLAAA